MDEQDKQFLENVASIWNETENEQMQDQAFSVIQRFTRNFFKRIKNIKCDPNTEDELAESGSLQDVLEIGEDKCSWEKLISIFDKEVVQAAAFDMPKPTFFGFIAGSGHFHYTIAEYVSSLTHVMASASFANSGGCKIEESVIKWVCEIVGYPDTATGVTVSGTSMGAVIAFATARDHILPALTDRHELKMPVIYIPEHAHGCNIRDFRVVGLSYCRYRRVPSVNCRMVADSLEAMIIQDKQEGNTPFLLVATMGSTAMGAIDPLEELAAITRKHNVWFHVDAAYGGFLLLDETVKSRCRGIEMSDSITLDFHKGLSAPYGHAAVLCRDRRHLLSSMSRHEDPYLPSAELVDYSPIELNFEYTRPFRAFPIWFLLKTFGITAIKSQMTEKIMLTEFAYNQLSQMANVSVYMKPELTILAFRYNTPSNDITLKWFKFLTDERVIYITGTTEDKLFYIRLCILSFRTHLDSVETALSSILRNLVKAQNDI